MNFQQKPYGHFSQLRLIIIKIQQLAWCPPLLLDPHDLLINTNMCSLRLLSISQSNLSQILRFNRQTFLHLGNCLLTALVVPWRNGINSDIIQFLFFIKDFVVFPPSNVFRYSIPSLNWCCVSAFSIFAF
jgi:hypothetical protein